MLSVVRSVSKWLLNSIVVCWLVSTAVTCCVTQLISYMIWHMTCYPLQWEQTAAWQYDCIELIRSDDGPSQYLSQNDALALRVLCATSFCTWCRWTAVTLQLSWDSFMKPKWTRMLTVVVSWHQSLFMVWISRRKTRESCVTPSGQRVCALNYDLWLLYASCKLVILQEALLLQRNRATRYVSWNIMAAFWLSYWQEALLI